MDSDKKLKRTLTQKLNRPRRWRWRRRDDNSSTVFLRKVELKTIIWPWGQGSTKVMRPSVQQ